MNACNFTSSAGDDCGLYIHVPFCARKCRYCVFYSVVGDADLQRKYLAAIRREFQLYAIDRPFCTCYIGGGSPTALEPAILLELTAWAADLLEDGAELTVEVNPAQASRDLLASLGRLGVSRISIGAQSFNEQQLEFLGRLHTVRDIYRCAEYAVAAGFGNIGFDLIYAIAGSAPSDWEKTLLAAVSLNPSHISAYALTYEKGSLLRQQLDEGQIIPVDDAVDRQMYDAAIEILRANGLRQYEISNFAREGFQCVHNLRYWRNLPFIGIGPSAAGCYGGRRTENIADLQRYLDMIDKDRFAYESDRLVGPQQLACETAVLALRTTAGIDLEQFRRRTGFDAMELFGSVIERHLSGGWLITDGRFLRLAPQAVAVADTFLCDFADIA